MEIKEVHLIEPDAEAFDRQGSSIVHGTLERSIAFVARTSRYRIKAESLENFRFRLRIRVKIKYPIISGARETECSSSHREIHRV